jgi:RNA polymerase sigma-70 factor, ECF subfamily
MDLSHPAAHTDAALAARVAAGDRIALAEVYARESGPVYRYCVAMCANPAWAADATQEAFIRFATQPQRFDAGRGALGAYLAGIARHSVLARWREPQGSVDENDDEAVDGDAQPEAIVVKRQDSARLMQAIGRLPVAFREALILVELQERSYAEAAAIAGIELNTLRTRLHRARTKLAALLTGAHIKEQEA